jgi:hypothetical protein
VDEMTDSLLHEAAVHLTQAIRCLEEATDEAGSHPSRMWGQKIAKLTRKLRSEVRRQQDRERSAANGQRREAA